MLKIAVNDFTNSDNEYIVYISDVIHKKYKKEIIQKPQMTFSDSE